MSHSSQPKPPAGKPFRWLWPAAALEALIVIGGLGLIVQCHSGDTQVAKPNATQPAQAIPNSN